MKKSALIVVISGALIVLGLILLALGNQIILEEVSQGNGKTSFEQDVIISAEFDSQETTTGIFAVQIMGIKEKIFSAKVLDPFDSEIISQEINKETTEEQFDVIETGVYKLIIQSKSDEETHVFGAIGPVPDESKKSLSFISVYIIIIGMAGLIGSGVYKIKNRKKSI